MEHKKCDQIIYWIHYHGYAVVLYTSLTECGCRVFPSQQNFVDQSKICGVWVHPWNKAPACQMHWSKSPAKYEYNIAVMNCAYI